MVVIRPRSVEHGLVARNGIHEKNQPPHRTPPTSRISASTSRNRFRHLGTTELPQLRVFPLRHLPTSRIFRRRRCRSGNTRSWESSRKSWGRSPVGSSPGSGVLLNDSCPRRRNVVPPEERRCDPRQRSTSMYCRSNGSYIRSRSVSVREHGFPKNSSYNPGYSLRAKERLRLCCPYVPHEDFSSGHWMLIDDVARVCFRDNIASEPIVVRVLDGWGPHGRDRAGC